MARESKTDNLIRMANEIATFHRSYTRQEAVQMIAEHLNKFWPPSMRKQLIELLTDQPESFSAILTLVKPQIRCEHHNPIEVVFKEKHGSGG